MVRISSSIHTRVTNALSLRKEILETELKVIELLQKLKKYKKENEEKRNLITLFKREISAVTEAVRKLEFENLPMDIEKEKRAEEAISRPQRKIREKIEEEIVGDELSQEIQNLKEKIEALKI